MERYIGHENDNFVDAPIINVHKNQYEYPGIEPYSTENKGVGVRAVSLLLNGFLFPYGGKYTSDSIWIQNQLKNVGKEQTYTHYLVDSVYDVFGKAIGWLDGHPRLYSKGIPLGAWIGSLVNEPCVGGAVNAQLVHIEGYREHNYPEMDWNMNVYVQLIQDVLPGEEICVDYGYSVCSYKTLGYACFKSPPVPLSIGVTTRKRSFSELK